MKDQRQSSGNVRSLIDAAKNSTDGKVTDLRNSSDKYGPQDTFTKNGTGSFTSGASFPKFWRLPIYIINYIRYGVFGEL
jgi:hypothetical protein